MSLTVSAAPGTEKQLDEYLSNEGMNEICVDHYLPSELHWCAGSLKTGRKYYFKM